MNNACGVIGNAKQNDYIMKMVYALVTIKSIRSLGTEFINPVPLSFS